MDVTPTMEWAIPKVRVSAEAVYNNGDTLEPFRAEPSVEEIMSTRVPRTQAKRRGRRRRTSKDPDPPPAEKTTDPTVEDLLPELLAEPGQPNMKLAFPIDLGEKDFGNGYGAGVTVVVNCGQTLEQARLAKDVSFALIREFIQEAADLGHEEYKKKKRRNPLGKQR